MACGGIRSTILSAGIDYYLLLLSFNSVQGSHKLYALLASVIILLVSLYKIPSSFDRCQIHQSQI